MNSDLKKYIWNQIDLVFEDVRNIRRHIHKNPELSGLEFGTAGFVASKLSEIGLQPQLLLNKTAALATFHNGKGPLIVLRADIDALPIMEETGLEYSSVNGGVMHACGHDMHTACLVGAARVLCNLRSYWSGTIVFLFQPQEEVEEGGASALIECGAFPSDTEAVFGLHVNAQHETGTVGIKKGIDYTGVLAFDVNIKGVGGHGGTPEEAIDPIGCTSHLILQLQALISREKSPFSPAVLTIGSVHAGSCRNVIPENATFSGTVRSHSPESIEFFRNRIAAIVDLTAQSYRCESKVTFGKPYPSVNNDIHLSDRFIDTFTSLSQSDKCIERPSPTMYAEDFAFYQQKAPGVYVHLGVRPKEKKSVPLLHSPRFNPDENALSTGIAVHVAFAMAMLGFPAL